jgi:hypothetical protein
MTALTKTRKRIARRTTATDRAYKAMDDTHPRFLKLWLRREEEPLIVCHDVSVRAGVGGRRHRKQRRRNGTA